MVNTLKNESCAVVLGAYLNGYSIIQELNCSGVEDIVVFQYGKDVAGYSRYVKKAVTIGKDAESLRKALFALRETYSYLVLFPTDDLQLELLKQIENEVRDFCFLPFNSENLSKSLDKSEQYKACEEIGIPYPKTLKLKEQGCLGLIVGMTFPLLIKPVTRRDLQINVFRNLKIDTLKDFEELEHDLVGYLEKGFEFLVSEIVPGDTNGTIHSYVAYISQSGKILNSWTGKKLTQFPDDYGIFSSGSNESVELVEKQGRLLVEGMNLFGIVQPEFKYDARDGQYKLMEINLRSMMWHRVGSLSGVKLQYSQWLDAIGDEVPKYEQITDEIIHFSYLKHEILNLVKRKGYYKYFKNNLFKGDKNHLGLFDLKDLKPLVYDLIDTLKIVLVSLARLVVKGGK